MRYSLPRYRPASRRAIQRQTEETVLFFCEIFYENSAREQRPTGEQMLISSNNALTLVLDVNTMPKRNMSSAVTLPRYILMWMVTPWLIMKLTIMYT